MLQENPAQPEQKTSGLREMQRYISVVVPALNEADSVGELLHRLDVVAGNEAYRMQVVLVDDGSTDNTSAVIADFQPRHLDSIVYLRFRTNFGKSTALSEGVDLCEADIIVTMDADLQDQPEEIPRLLATLDSGYDVVSGWKKTRNDPLFGKKIPSYVFNWLVRKILGTTLRDINCGLKAYRRAVWDEIRVYGELHRFIPALAQNNGFLIGEIEVEHKPRKFGTSKFGASRFVKGTLDLLTVFFLNAYRHRPLHFFGGLGGAVGLIGFVGALYLTILWFMGQPIGTRPLLLLSVLLIIIGVQVVLFGLLSQLLIELFHKNYKSQIPAIITRKDRLGDASREKVGSPPRVKSH